MLVFEIWLGLKSIQSKPPPVIKQIDSDFWSPYKSSYTPVVFFRKSLLSSNVANVAAAAGMLLSNEGESPLKRAFVPPSLTIARNSSVI